MRLIRASYSIVEQQPGLKGVFKQIEAAGRTCYKSENKITEDSYDEFVSRMITNKHNAMLEHGTVYLKIPKDNDQIVAYKNKYESNPYSKVNYTIKRISGTPMWEDFSLYITTNYRVLVENNWLNDLDFICEPTDMHEKRVTVRFICDKGITHEFVRHRVFSFAQESSRYCNYSSNKFRNELTFIIPCWSQTIHEDKFDFPSPVITEKERIFLDNCSYAEKSYLNMIASGAVPQEARQVLPTAIKTELVMTGFISDWKGFFLLRDSKAAHPQAYELANPLHNEFITRGYIDC